MTVSASLLSDKERVQFLVSMAGKPYKAGARGPKEYDCYGLVLEVYRTLRGVELPDMHSASSESPKAWRFVKEPADLAIVFMRTFEMQRHVGIYLKEGGILHAIETWGVIFEPISNLSLRGNTNIRMVVQR